MNLRQAIASGDCSAIQQVILAGAPIYDDALRDAIASGNCSAIQDVILAGAPIYDDALRDAIASGNCSAIQQVILAGAPIYDDALRDAIASGKSSAIQQVIHAGAPIYEDALRDAIARGNCSAIQQMEQFETEIEELRKQRIAREEYEKNFIQLASVVDSKSKISKFKGRVDFNLFANIAEYTKTACNENEEKINNTP